MRAVVEHHGADSLDLPRVEFIIGKGKEDLTIQVNHLCCIYCKEIVSQLSSQQIITLILYDVNYGAYCRTLCFVNVCFIMHVFSILREASNF